MTPPMSCAPLLASESSSTGLPLALLGPRQVKTKLQPVKPLRSSMRACQRPPWTALGHLPSVHVSADDRVDPLVALRPPAASQNGAEARAILDTIRGTV